MKTIIIDLPPNLSPNGIGLALRAIADDILTGAVVPVPPFHYCVDTAVGTVTFWDVDNEERIAPAANVVDHPPLGTTLADFTAEQLDRLPVGSRFGPTVSTGYAIEKGPDGWRFSPGDESINDFGPKYDQRRPLIRVGPEQASEPALTPCGQVPRFTGQCPKHGDRCPTPSATLPDPWPKMMIEYATSTLGWARGTVAYACADPDDPTYVLLETDDPNDPDDGIEWCAENIREVRTPDGTTLWKRPAAKVTTEPRALSTYTADEIRAFPVGTEIDDPKSPTVEARSLRYCLLTPDGWTHGRWYTGPALTMDEFIRWEVPRQPAALVHFPAKVTT